MPLVTSRIDGQLYGAVNVHAFDGVDPALLQAAAASFNGESVDERLARRWRYWIADIEYVESGA